jgi:hypothetical protein
MRREEFLFTLLDRTRLDDGVNKKNPNYLNRPRIEVMKTNRRTEFAPCARRRKSMCGFHQNPGQMD